jgi:hypothetical protein
MGFQPSADDWHRPQSADARQWEWVRVQCAEIRRLAAEGDEAHDRLALLLIDNLAEVVLDREFNARMAVQMADSVMAEVVETRDSGVPLPPVLAEAVERHVGPDERARIDRHFTDKCKYLVRVGWITDQERQVLLRLHDYRNEAYHQDKVTSDLLSDLVLTYLLLVGDLLIRHRPLAWTMTTVVKVADGFETFNFPPPTELGKQLRGDDEADLEAVGRRLTDHVRQRVEEIEFAIGTATLIRFLHENGNEATQETPEDYPLSDWEEALVNRVSEIPQRSLARWRRRGDQLVRRGSTLGDVMVRYIQLDRDLRGIEPDAHRWATLIRYVAQRDDD